MTSAPTKRPTVADVAREAGVSAGTVSAVINRKPTVAPDTRDLVLGVIGELGYQPRGGGWHAAEAAAGDGARVNPCVGVIIKEDDNPFYSEVVAGARAALAEAGYTTFASSSEGDHVEEGRLLDVVKGRAFSGAIVAPVAGVDADLSHLFLLQMRGFPLVVLEEVRGLRSDSVWIDAVAGAEAAVRHLIELGHERIVYLAGPAYTRRDDQIEGVRRAFSASPLVFSDEVVVEAGAHFDDGYREGLRVFADPDARPTGVVCFNDLVAMGLLRALHESGLRVPDDVSVVGHNDIPSAAYLSPPLTTVKSPAREVGRRAASMLLRRIAPANVEDREGDPRRVVLDPELVLRASTRRLA